MKTSQKSVLLSAALATFSLLGACDSGFSAAPRSFDVGLNPNPLGFSATSAPETGIISFDIPAHTLTFASSAGGVGVTITGYDIEFFESSQNPAFPGDSVQHNSGSLNLYVPPGLICPRSETGGDEGSADTGTVDCTVNTPGVAFERGIEVTSRAITLVPRDIANSLYKLRSLGGAVGAYARVTFYGTDDLQRHFESQPYQFAIQIEGS